LDKTIALMAIDHVRDYFSNSAGVFDPTDLRYTSAALFLTRWITHFCAPVFVFLAGTGSYLAGRRGRTPVQLFHFLWTRGLWLIVLEVLFVTPFGWSFQWDLSFVRLQVIWVLGVSMILLAFLSRLPSAVVGWLGVAIMALHNLWDRSKSPLAQLMHSVSFHQPLPGHTVGSLYPIIPWCGVLFAGFGAGPLWDLHPSLRQVWLRRLAWIGIIGFVAIRAINGYGDPSPWITQSDALRTALSFLNVSKYPPSLAYLLMTLSVAAAALAILESRSFDWLSPFRTLGRAPLFFYLLHLPWIHGLAVLFSNVRHGSARWLFQDPFLMRRPPVPAPPDYGYELSIVYLVWLLLMVLSIPLCLRYAAFKSNRRHSFWSYL
jgi:uncharacterized membrane protein